jgi:DHA1 family tetracycline resistance protein-like MFS transporter
MRASMIPRKAGKNALVFVMITVLLDVITFGLIAPVLPSLLVDLTGDPVNRVAIYGGWLAFIFAFNQFICAPILGGLSDRFGRRPVLLAAVAMLGVDYLIMGFAPTLGWLFVGRFLSGIAGASFTPAYAFVADVSPPAKRAQNFGLISASFGIGFIIGPAIGGLLGSFGPRTPFFVAAAVSLANFIYGVLVLPESLPEERRRPFEWRRANPLGTLLRMRRHPAVLGLLGAFFVWAVAHQVMPSTWTFYTKFRFGWSEATIGVSLALAGAMMALSQATLVRVLVPRWGERRTALTGIAVAAVGYLGYALATEGWMMFAWLGTWLFGAMVMPTTNAYMSHQIEPEAQGELQGAIASLYSLSAIAGPPLMTQLFAHFSGPDAIAHVPGAAFFASAILAAFCFAIYWIAARDRPAAADAAPVAPPVVPAP